VEEMKNEFIDCKTLAEELRVSKQFLRQLVRKNKIPFYRLSARTLRFDPNEVREYMRRQGNHVAER
jgi:excisionase family DNA binding protein